MIPVFDPNIYGKWLNKTAEFYEVEPRDIISASRIPQVCIARQTFYWLCSRDGINLSRLSVALGKNRTTVVSNMNKSSHLRDVTAEKIIYNEANTIKAR